ncbi:Sbal_3080 family lipoprotein [Pseudomonas koreensis]|uniref:Sbal_3080 family lipoprotein n=1 Tax=Pseudomonas koreensis TaxID=198620 RepID=UPI0021C56D92|nr:Sbal_3080 family lipoprotein [Pseudomonas koreensis]MCU0072718.1 Sbal_3080 family lipoprotein [Pseudomonas koreensis]
MLSRVVTIGFLLALAGCTNVRVEPVAPQYKISRLCIEENPKVVVGDFVAGVQTLLRRHGIDSQVYAAPVPANCEYRMTYTAVRSWDLSMYLSDATVQLYKGEEPIGSAHYNLTNEGGLDLSKLASVEEKMAPVFNQMLGQKQ